MEIFISEHNEKKIIVLLDKEMKIVKPVYDFLRFQQQKGRAINTLKAYGTDLCLFWTFLKKNDYTYDQVTPRLIAEFIDYLCGGYEMLSLYRESIRSNRTINRILSTVHSFYQYQADMHEIDNSILMHEINRPFNMFKGILAHTKSDNKTKQSVFKLKESQHIVHLAIRNVREKKAERFDQNIKKKIANDENKDSINNYIADELRGKKARGYSFPNSRSKLAEIYYKNERKWMTQENLFCYFALHISVISMVLTLAAEYFDNDALASALANFILYFLSLVIFIVLDIKDRLYKHERFSKFLEILNRYAPLLIILCATVFYGLGCFERKSNMLYSVRFVFAIAPMWAIVKAVGQMPPKEKIKK